MCCVLSCADGFAYGGADPAHADRDCESVQVVDDLKRLAVAALPVAVVTAAVAAVDGGRGRAVPPRPPSAVADVLTCAPVAYRVWGGFPVIPCHPGAAFPTLCAFELGWRAAVLWGGPVS